MTTTAKRASIAFGISTLITAGAITLSDFRAAIAQEKPELRIAAIIAVTGPASALGTTERLAVNAYRGAGAAGAKADDLAATRVLSQIKRGKFVLIEE